LTQLDLFPPEEQNADQLAKKLILLYLIDKFDIPLSYNHISKFAVDEASMNYFQLDTYLHEMTEVGYLEKSSNDDSTHYTVTDEGVTALESFIKSIPGDIKTKVTKFAADNHRTAKKDFQNITNYFFDKESDEYIVKCGVYEDNMTLMEINLSVVSKEQALTISNNWKEDTSNLYGQILNLLLNN
jgi:DNA-binding PadR family transcriptional regulator